MSPEAEAKFKHPRIARNKRSLLLVRRFPTHLDGLKDQVFKMSLWHQNFALCHVDRCHALSTRFEALKESRDFITLF